MIDARPRFYVLLSAMLLTAAWLVTRGLNVPIYDGIGFPDEPYRFLQPPANYRSTPSPTTARAELPLKAGRIAAATVNSAESGPQVSLYFPTGGLTVTGAGPVTVTATPVPPPVTPPGHSFWSNVYQVAAVSGAAPAVLSTKGAQIQLRAPNAQQPGPKLEVLDGSTWRPLKTYRTGNDIYAGALTKLGDFALVSDHPFNPNGPQDTSSDGAVGALGLGLGFGGAFIALIVFVRAERTRSRRRRERLEAR